MKARGDVSLRALYDVIDAQRRLLGLSWAAATREVSHGVIDGHRLATSTITGLQDKGVAEGDGVLQMLPWLGRTPESFVPGVPDADAERFGFPSPVMRIVAWLGQPATRFTRITRR